jgi:hypothetical protein
MMVAACDTPISSGDDGAVGGAGGPADPAVSLALLQPNQGGATAASAGILAVRGRCLVLEAGGARTNLAFATPQTVWDAAAGTLHVGSRAFRLGEKIEVGGALFTGDPAILPWVRRPQAECLEHLWIVSSIGPD